jgi:NIMA (never in mitosis gene a)-related kinase 1/4/5
MELGAGGDLDIMIKAREQHFEEQDILHYFCQILSAVEYLHIRNILHRDIKPQNVFVDAK